MVDALENDSMGAGTDDEETGADEQSPPIVIGFFDDTSVSFEEKLVASASCQMIDLDDHELMMAIVSTIANHYSMKYEKLSKSKVASNE